MRELEEWDMIIEACTAEFVFVRGPTGEPILRAKPNQEVIVTDLLVVGYPANDEEGGS